MYQYIFLTIFFISAIMDLIGIVKEIKKLERFFKPLLMPMLVLYYIFGIVQFIDWLIVVALICCFMGDTLLMLENEKKWLKFGMSAFLLGHIFYIISFWVAIGANIFRFPYFGLIFVIPAIIIILITYPKFRKDLGDLKIPVHVYIGAILLMHISAIFRLSITSLYPGFILVWLGSLLFILSDSLHAIYSFSKETKIPHIRFLYMITYILAQFFIVQGVIMSNLLL